MGHTKPPFRVGGNGNCVIADDDTGLNINGTIGEDAVRRYGGNLIAETVTPGNAQFIVDACNHYWRVIEETRAEILRVNPRPKQEPERRLPPTDAANALINRFDNGDRFVSVPEDGTRDEVTNMQASTVDPDEVMIQVNHDNSEWYSEKREALIEAKEAKPAR